MRCPICHEELTAEASVHRPFCSPRCKTIDLGKWLTESYRIPTSEQAEEGEPEPRQAEGESGEA